MSSRAWSRLSPGCCGCSALRSTWRRCQRPRLALTELRVLARRKSKRASVASWNARLLAAIISRRCSAPRYCSTAEIVCATSSASATDSSICPSRLLGRKRRIGRSGAIGRGAANVGGEAVATAPYGLDQLRIAAVGFHLAAQAADLVVDRAVEQVRLAALDHVEQAVAVEHLARMVEERAQQPELGRGQRHHGAVRIGQAALQGIEPPALEFVRRVFLGGGGRPRGAAQHRADAGDQLARLERLD